MTGASAQLKAAIATRLAAQGRFTGVYDDTPARPEFPYVVVHCPDEKAWNVDGREGRELRIELCLWDDQPSRLQRDDQHLAVTMPPVPALEGWRLVSLVELSRQRSRDPSGPWSCKAVLRARVFADVVS